jgi:hypothetical protein
MRDRGLAIALVVGMAGCGGGGGGDTTRHHAVGTYIGGGSMLGPDDCTYRGTAGVFHDHADEAQRGPRMVTAPGTITVTCAKTSREVIAVQPTGATISGETEMTVGATQILRANLVDGHDALDGEGAPDWHLGSDCAGIAEFGPVLGAQDTGGKDKTRDLVAHGAGTCHVAVAITTGSPAGGEMAVRVLDASTTITVK